MLTTYYNYLKELNHELSVVESTDPIKNLGNEQIDMLICLSGRGNFNGDFTITDHAKFKKQGRECDLSNIDTSDTCRRMAMTIEILKAYHRNTGKVAPIFFNGSKEQNNQLRDILSSQGHYLGVPPCLFVIDDIPMDTTVGQAIGLRVFVEKHKNMFGLRNPKFVFVSSSYHVPRVLRTFGSDSPLMRPKFYETNVAVLEALNCEMKRYVLEKICLMQKAEIYTYGIDRSMMVNPGAEVDIKNDREAVINYSLKQTLPSISNIIPLNVMQYRNAVVSMSLQNAKFFKKLVDTNAKQCIGIRIKF